MANDSAPHSAQRADVAPLFPFDNSYVRLPERFYAKLAPTAVSSPRLIKLNAPLAAELGLDALRLASAEGVAVMAGNAVPDNTTSLAQAYAGHQFGGFSPQLGDGRALLIGEVVGRDGRRRDIQLKGSGPTPFSRRGDGRAALGPVLREYIVSEAMHALRIPTTRSLAVVATGDWVFREQPLPGAVLTRVAASHIRVGTFQYFAARGDQEGLRLLADHVIARHYPEARTAANPYRALLEAVMSRQAHLVAQWMGAGFIHGVMNTDNASISGETIDFGPCAYLDTYHPATVFSSIDQNGRYAYANQPRIAQWNMARLAETLLGLLAADADEALKEAQALIDAFPTRYEPAYAAVMRSKLGLARAEEGDVGLATDLLALMADHEADFTLAFRALSHAAEGVEAEADLREQFKEQALIGAWVQRWRARLAREFDDGKAISTRMLATNPAVIPRNHRVEEAIAAAYADDFAPFERLVDVLQAPFTETDDTAPYRRPPETHEIVQQTFCGT